MKNIDSKTIVSGINPSSSMGLHLGNYLGAVKQHVILQSAAKKAFYFIANYHSLNTVFDSEILSQNVLNTYMDYMSFGLKPENENVVFFVENGVPEICELNIILNNSVTMSELKKMHAYKDKFSKGLDEENINHGLFNYPVLMAADILIFDADVVPVGEDQAQHVEIARDIAKHFNNRYGDILKLPQVLMNPSTAKVIGTDGERKMSKSLGNVITVFGTEDEVRKQIFATKTDPNRIKPSDPGDPDKNIIFSYMQFLDFDDVKLEEYKSRYKEGSIGDVEIKKEFYEFFLEYFRTMRTKRAELAANVGDVVKIMIQNNQEAREVAQTTMEKIRSAVGLN